MTTITKEQVHAVSDLKAGYTLGHADVAILQRLARIALASLEAEPVAWRYFQETQTDGGYWILHVYKPNCSGVEPLYTAPPALVPVPDEVTAEDCPAFVKYDVTDADDAWARGFNACRAAMLQGAEPVTTAYKLPEGWVAVPVEPTEEMIAAAMCSNDVLFDKKDDTLFRVQHGEIWRAMLSTAPQQEADNG